MVQKLILLGVVMALLTGCTKENATPDPLEKGCMITSELVNDKTYRTYEYDTDQKLYRIVQYETNTANRVEKRYSFDYNQKNQVVAFRETNLLTPNANYQYLLQYSETGQLDTIRKSQILNSGPKFLETYALEYDDQQRLNKYKWAENYWRYEYDEANNVIKWFAKYPALAPIEGLVADFGNYDGKYNTYAFSKPAQLVNLVSGGGASPQNPGSFKFYEASLTPTQTGVVTYLYNDKRLPTEASISLFTPQGSNSTQVYQFVYDCP